MTIYSHIITFIMLFHLFVYNLSTESSVAAPVRNVVFLVDILLFHAQALYSYESQMAESHCPRGRVDNVFVSLGEHNPTASVV
jgi:hypothetical protein